MLNHDVKTSSVAKKCRRGTWTSWREEREVYKTVLKALRARVTNIPERVGEVRRALGRIRRRAYCAVARSSRLQLVFKSCRLQGTPFPFYIKYGATLLGYCFYPLLKVMWRLCHGGQWPNRTMLSHKPKIEGTAGHLADTLGVSLTPSPRQTLYGCRPPP